MKQLFIEPNDVLLFRDGRPFSAGADHLAVGIFPPGPIPFYGAIRSTIVSQQNISIGSFKAGQVPDDVKEEIGTPKGDGQLTISFFSLARKAGPSTAPSVELLFPLPGDILQNKDKGKEDELIAVKPYPLPFGIRTNASLQTLWNRDVPESSFFEKPHKFVRAADFQSYLCGQCPAGRQLIPAEKLYQPEPRTGIQLLSTKTTGEGKLFSVGFTRLNRHVGFALQLEHAAKLETPTGLLRLGGEARSAFYTECAFRLFDRQPVEEMVQKSRRFKLVILTPTVFQAGWRPDGIGEDNRGSIGGVAVEMVGAAVGRFQHLGGWDMAQNRPRPTERAVPPGSVYFFEMRDGDVQALFDTCFLQSLTGSKSGLGLTVIGGY